MNISTIKFSRTKDMELMNTLRKRVNDYFKENNISKYANRQMVIKTIFMLALYFVPYGLMLSGIFSNDWVILSLWVLMALGMAGIGMSVMHDANHGSFSKKSWVNKLLGNVIIFVGGNSSNWIMQHNIKHHTYTNIHGLDDDLDVGNLMRFSPTQPKYKIYKLQFLYAWILYGFLTVSWSLTKDFIQAYQFKKQGYLKQINKTYTRLLTEIIVSKILYYAYVLVIPMLVLDIVWWKTLLFVFIMHFIAGFILSVIFQAAHVIETSEFKQIPDDGKIEDNWFVHQLQTTANFAPKNKILSWYVGGLNYQIEHHLFPNICHIHYQKISKIVKETVQEYGIKYNVQPRFRDAIYNHGRMLWLLGRI